MQNRKDTILYRGVAYLRTSAASKENKGYMDESNSIHNQQRIIEEYLEEHPEIQLIKVRIDDGYSGTDFERPGFRQMLSDLQNEANCVLVKDLSRLGRNYIGCGKYIERQFKTAGIRFVSVTEQIDTHHALSETNALMLPLKNLMNELVSANLSLSTRSQLDARRRAGKFTGSYPTFGYKKAKNDKNQLVIDETAAGVVRRIFLLKIRGVSMARIAHHLNCLNIFSPLAYKQSQGINIKTGFQIYKETKWEATAVKRILTNRAYTGRLEQKKTTTPSYKVKKRIALPEDEWICQEHAHEAIVDPDLYDAANLLVKLTRSQQKDIFNGIIKCGHCGGPMSCQTVYYKEKKYRYYLCKQGKHKKSNRIKTALVEKSVLSLINTYIKQYADVFAKIKGNGMDGSELEVEQLMIMKRISDLKRQQEEYEVLLKGIRKDVRSGILEPKEGKEIKSICHAKIESADRKIRHLEDMDAFLANGDQGGEVSFYENVGFNRLTAPTVKLLIAEIKVYSKKGISVKFNWNKKQMNILHI